MAKFGFMRRPMQTLARWHIWLGWIVAVPILLWTLSGLVMVAKPIEEVRGEHLRTEASPIPASGLVLPRLTGDIAKLALVESGGRAVWVVTGSDKAVHRYDARTGAAFGPVGVSEAQILARKALKSDTALTGIQRFAADGAPLDLRKPRPSWQATFADGTHVYIDADSGEVLALRTRFWRFYDMMWGLHIMDPAGREDSHHPLIIVAAALTLAAALAGTTLLFRKRKAAIR